MTAAAQTSEPANPTTGSVRLRAAVRWLLILLLMHWLIIGGRRLAAALRQGTAHPDFPLFAKRFGTDDPDAIRARIASALRHARALAAELLTTGPTDPRLTDIAYHRAIDAVIIEIGRDLGVFRAAPARIVYRRHNAASHLNRAQGRSFPLTLRPPTTTPATCVQPTACPGLRAVATGPPTPVIASAARRREAIPIVLRNQNAGVPRIFSGCAPASFLLYELS